ncbi:hypothetical protein CPB83DRAFT_197455 [Crepidotus variabilis]|uniref:Uncharacterized protein n=1 Tax=Crepidotus variabilis TaxID=179855 RepID=A0A9P6EJH2_9AGAR|nr:hypothetical protein CPB83DRAFT_197455 [Crepidotus variabilis]
MEHKMSDNCAGVTTIVNAALGTNTRKGVVFRDQAKALEMQQKLYGLYKEQSKLNRALNHALTRKDQQTRTDEYRKNEISGTAEERQEAVESLDRVQKDDVRDILTLPILEKPLRATADCPVVEINEEELDRYDDDNGSSCQLDNDVLSWADGLNRTIQVEERIIEDEIAVPKSLNLIVNQYGPLFDANEPQELADAPDVDEAVEVDVFAMDIKHVRRRFFDYLTAPARKEKQVVVIDDNIVDDVIKDAVETYPCTVCIERGFNKVFSCRSHLVRHNLQIHSKWKELEWNGIRRPGEKRFHCPSEQCSASYVALSKVFTHMLNKCRDSEKWIALKAAHQLGAKQYKGAKYVDRTDVTFIPGNHEDLIGLAEMAHWYQDDHISNAIKEDYAELAVDALRPTEPEDASLDALDWYLSSHLNRLTTAARPSTVVAKAGEPFELDGLDFKTFYSKMSTKPYTAIRPPLW